MTRSDADRATPTPAFLGIVPLLMVLLYGVDVYLARLEKKEVRLEAHQHFTEGTATLRKGETRAAIDTLRRAYSLERANLTYALALASAQIMDGQLDAARFILDDVLRQDPNNARANLLMARLSVRRGNIALADSFYHRAIYGAWDAEPEKQRLDARLELAELLAERGSEEQLLAEILTLQNSAPGSVDITKKIAALYLKAKSASRAVAAYRTLIRDDPADAEGYAGLAEAEILRGNYRLAQSAYGSALRRRPIEPSWEQRARLADRLAGLDPTLRRLASSDRFKRSVEVLSLVETAIAACHPDGAIPKNLQSLLDRSRQLRGERPRASTMNEQAEALVEAAEELWAAGTRRCAAAPGKNDPLPVLMTKISAGS
jgi:Tfp pilus assembly protein PilF